MGRPKPDSCKKFAAFTGLIPKVLKVSRHLLNHLDKYFNI